MSLPRTDREHIHTLLIANATADVDELRAMLREASVKIDATIQFQSDAEVLCDDVAMILSQQAIDVVIVAQPSEALARRLGAMLRQPCSPVVERLLASFSFVR